MVDISCSSLSLDNALLMDRCVFFSILSPKSGFRLLVYSYNVCNASSNGNGGCCRCIFRISDLSASKESSKLERGNCGRCLHLSGVQIAPTLTIIPGDPCLVDACRNSCLIRSEVLGSTLSLWAVPRLFSCDSEFASFPALQ